MRQHRWGLFIVALFSLLSCHSGQQQIAYGTLERERVLLTAVHDKILLETFVEEGEQVEKGKLLVRLDDSLEQFHIDEALGNLRSARARLTIVTYGQAEAVVVATGEQSEIGKISRSLHHIESMKTPLLRRIDSFAKWLTLSIVLVATGMFIFGIFVRDYTVPEMFMVATSIGWYCLISILLSFLRTT